MVLTLIEENKMAEQTLSLETAFEGDLLVARFANFWDNDLTIFLSGPNGDQASLSFSPEEISQIKTFLNERFPNL
jgi:hypothetical protein